MTWLLKNTLLLPMSASAARFLSFLRRRRVDWTGHPGSVKSDERSTRELWVYLTTLQGVYED
jgi:hypothetical protein